MKQFTLHFATINTTDTPIIFLVLPVFTLHFATINTKEILLFFYSEAYLHYTLLLLIRF